MFELSAAQKQLQANACEFAKKEIAPRAAEVDRTEKYPWKMWSFLKIKDSWE